MSAKTFYLSHDTARRAVGAYALTAPAGWRVAFSEPLKKRVQEDKYHAMIGDIAKQWEFIGRKWHKDDMKRILIDMFANDMREIGKPLRHDSRIVPSIDGKRIVQLDLRSSDFTVGEASSFIEWLYAFGDEREIVWSEPGVQS